MVSFMQRSSFIEQSFPVSPIFNNRYTVQFCDYSHDDLAAAFSTISLTELEQNYSSWLVVENNMSLFAENSEVFLFCLSILSADKTPKKIDRYLVNREEAI